MWFCVIIEMNGMQRVEKEMKGLEVTKNKGFAITRESTVAIVADGKVIR